MSNDHHDVRLDGHNASPPTGVERRPTQDDITSSAGTTVKGIDIMDTPPQDYETHKMNDAKAAEKSVSDEESGGVGGVSNVELARPGLVRRFYRRFRPFFHVFFFLFLTA